MSNADSGAFKIPTPLESIDTRLLELAKDIEELDVCDWERATSDRLASGLRPRVLSMGEEALALCTSILAVFDTETDEAEEDLEKEDATAAALSSAAFFSRMTLSEAHRRLAALGHWPRQRILIAACDSSFRSIRRTLNTLDEILAPLLDRPPLQDPVRELQASVMVRMAYAKLRYALRMQGPPEPEKIRVRLRLAGTQLAILRGRSEFSRMRLPDRLMIVDLQDRLLQWLASQDSAQDGLRVWSDLCASVEMMMQINQRQELVAHDVEISQQVDDWLEQDASPMSQRVSDGLSRVLGRDSKLDELVLGQQLEPNSQSASELRKRLAAIKLTMSSAAAE